MTPVFDQERHQAVKTGSLGGIVATRSASGYKCSMSFTSMMYKNEQEKGKVYTRRRIGDSWSSSMQLQTSYSLRSTFVESLVVVWLL